MVNSSSVKGEDLASRMEIAILQKVSHDPNIVQFIGACLLEPVLLVMEYLEVRSKSVHKCKKIQKPVSNPEPPMSWY